MPNPGTKTRYYKKESNILNLGFCKEFKKKHPRVKEDAYELKKILHDIFDTASDMIIDSSDGVMLNHFGYFVPTAYVKSKVVKKDDRVHMNYSDPFVYRVMMFPDIIPHNIGLNCWTFKLHRGKARMIPEKIESGIRYTNHYSFLKSL